MKDITKAVIATLNTFVDQNGTKIELGDVVECTKGRYKGEKFQFVFCIPQHRFGFIWCGNGERKWDNILDHPDLKFYYTPRSVKEIVKTK